jgi:hypothetical protein
MGRSFRGLAALLIALAGTAAAEQPSSGSFGQGITEGILAEDGSLHVLYVNGAQVVLRLSADGSLSGEYVSETHRYVGKFNRQQ